MRVTRPTLPRSRRRAPISGACAALALLFAGPAFGITVRDVIELSRAGVGEDVLVELIGSDDAVERPDVAAVRDMKAARVPDVVILAMLRASRPRSAEPYADAQPAPVEYPGVAVSPEIAWDAEVASQASDDQRPIVSVNESPEVDVPAFAVGVGQSPNVGNLYPVPLVVGGGGHHRRVDGGWGHDQTRTKDRERPFWIVKNEGWIIR